MKYLDLCFSFYYTSEISVFQSVCSLIPRPPPSFCRLQYEKRGRPGIFYHVSDVEGREKVERT